MKDERQISIIIEVNRGLFTKTPTPSPEEASVSTTRIVGTRTIEMMWTCRHCGRRNQGLSGRTGESVRCDGCGADKPASQAYEMPSDTATAPTVSDPALLALIDAGPNWPCSFCGSSQRATHRSCQACGASRDHGSHDLKSSAPPPATRSIRATAAAAASTLRTDGASSDHQASAYTQHNDVAEDSYRAGGSPKLTRPFPTSYAYAALGILGAIGLVAFLVWLFGTHKTEATIERNSWRYTESLRQKTLESGADWRDQMHAGAFNAACERRQRGTEDCHPHTCNCHNESYDCRCTGGDSYDCRCTERESCRDNGNGSATCTTTRSCDTCYTPKSCDTCYQEKCDTCYDQCPVYDDWCTYQYYDWPEIQHAEEHGSGIDVKWPGLQVRGTDQRLDRAEEYRVQFTDGEHHWTLKPVTYNEYKLYPVGTRHRVEYSRAGQFQVLQHIP